MTRVAVIGGGHNGLVCACFLADAGLDVTVFEANATVGGCIWTEHLPSGYRLERGAIDHGMILGIAEELGLERFGLEYAFRDVSVGAGFGDGTRLLFHRELATTMAGFGDLDPGDIEGYRRLAELGSALLGMMDTFVSPPSLAQIADLGSVAGFDPLRMVLASAEKVVGAHIADPHLVAALTMYGAFSQLPPWLPGTGLFGLLLAGSHGHGAGRPIGGSVQLVNALTRALESAGGTIRTSAAVVSIDRSGAETRITTATGDTTTFDRVVSALDLARTARLMAEPVPELDEAARMLTSGSLNVAEFKVDLALSAEAEPGRFGHPEAIWLLQQHPGSMARSFGEIAAGTYPSEPAMLWASPSALDPSAAPEGGGVAWLSTFVPARLRHGEWTGAEVIEACGAGDRRLPGRHRRLAPGPDRRQAGDRSRRLGEAHGREARQSQPHRHDYRPDVLAPARRRPRLPDRPSLALPHGRRHFPRRGLVRRAGQECRADRTPRPGRQALPAG